jgi:hypothetical protein
VVERRRLVSSPTAVPTTSSRISSKPVGTAVFTPILARETAVGVIAGWRIITSHKRRTLQDSCRINCYFQIIAVQTNTGGRVPAVATNTSRIGHCAIKGKLIKCPAGTGRFASRDSIGGYTDGPVAAGVQDEEVVIVGTHLVGVGCYTCAEGHVSQTTAVADDNGLCRCHLQRLSARQSPRSPMPQASHRRAQAVIPAIVVQINPWLGAVYMCSPPVVAGMLAAPPPSAKLVAIGNSW